MCDRSRTCIFCHLPIATAFSSKVGRRQEIGRARRPAKQLLITDRAGVAREASSFLSLLVEPATTMLVIFLLMCHLRLALYWCLASSCALVPNGLLFGNNLSLGGLKLAAPKSLGFVVQWENHWQMPEGEAPYNHDAVWIFAHTFESGQWKPLLFSPGAVIDHAEQPFVAKVRQDGFGLLIRRNRPGNGQTGPLAFNIPLLQEPSTAEAIRLFGIEMVHITEGPFYVGDGASNGSLVSGIGQPYFLNNELTISTNANGLTSMDENQPDGDIPQAYPKGYRGFYCMKYEIGQEQFKDFLNTLGLAAQSAHTAISPMAQRGSAALALGPDRLRNSIVIENPATNGRPAVYACQGQESTAFNGEKDGKERACNWLDWYNVSAYLDWAGLRPMSELEFEKACRGFGKPVQKEYAWGSQLSVNANTPVFDGTDRERVAETPSGQSGLANHGGAAGSSFLQGPLRSGFAADESSNRLASGSSFFGAMDMSGNLWEMVVNLSADGLLFTGEMGDGILTDAGAANQTNWPDPVSASGAGYRGGAWNSWVQNDLSYPFRDLAISDRFYAYLSPNNRRGTSGGRGVLVFE